MSIKCIFILCEASSIFFDPLSIGYALDAAAVSWRLWDVAKAHTNMHLLSNCNTHLTSFYSLQCLQKSYTPDAAGSNKNKKVVRSLCSQQRIWGFDTKKWKQNRGGETWQKTLRTVYMCPLSNDRDWMCEHLTAITLQILRFRKNWLLNSAAGEWNVSVWATHQDSSIKTLVSLCVWISSFKNLPSLLKNLTSVKTFCSLSERFFNFLI